jgi:L-glyceraldehyde 3-phosphate reductase
MRYRPLGSTGLKVSEIGFGCGTTAGVLSSRASQAQQERVVGTALDRGINYFDTSPAYPGSEDALGSVLARLKATPIIATKVRLTPAELVVPLGIMTAVRRSAERSLRQLGVDCLDVLQLHNPVVDHRQVEFESTTKAYVTAADALADSGVAAAFDELRTTGKIRFGGIGCVGSVPTICELVASRRFDTALVVLNLLNPSAGRQMPISFRHKDYAAVADIAATLGMGVVVMRALAGGTLTSATATHPLAREFTRLARAEIEADRVRAGVFDFLVRDGQTLAQAALRFVLGTQGVSTTLIGFSDTSQIDELSGGLEDGSLTADEWSALEALYGQTWPP